MRFISTKTRSDGLMAMCIGADGIYTVLVTWAADGGASVRFASFMPLGLKALPEVLERLCKDAHAKRYQCSLLLLQGEYQVFAVDALNVPREELKSAMRWRLKELLDYHIDDATIDVLNIPGDKSANGRSHGMFAIAARNTLIADRQGLFLSAGIPLSIIDIPDLAQRNISALLEENERGLAMLSFDETGGLLTVTCGGELFLSRRLDVRIAQLSAMSEERVAAEFERITLELQRSLDHFDRQHHAINTAKLILAPCGDLTDELKTYLAANIYLPVELLDLSQVIDLGTVAAVKDITEQSTFLMTIGAALRREELSL